MNVTISTIADVTSDAVILNIPLHALHVTETRFSRYEHPDILFVPERGSVSILPALVRFVRLRLIQGVPKVNIIQSIDIWTPVETVDSILVVCAPSYGLLSNSLEEGRVGVVLDSQETVMAGRWCVAVR